MKRVVVFALALLAACKTTAPPLPPRDAVETLASKRPKIPDAAIGDPSASTTFRDVVRSWEDSMMSAGGRVCRWAKSRGMDVEC